MIQKLLNKKTDKLIGILFIPCILIGIIPLTPVYNKLIDSIDLIFIIIWIQLGMLFITSFWITDLLNTIADKRLKINLRQFWIHSCINYLLITLWLGQIIFPSVRQLTFELFPLLVLVLFISELYRLKIIAKLLVSLELNKKAKFKDYILTMLLISSLYGAWNIHQRIQTINNKKTTAPNRIARPASNH